MMWLLDWPYLWLATLALLLVTCGLLVRERLRNRRHEARLALPLLPRENGEVLALGWEHKPSQEAQPPVESDTACAAQKSPALDLSPHSQEAAALEPEQEKTSPLATVFNCISSPGGVCARHSPGDALREQEPIIRAAVDTGDGRETSFKIAGTVEWPLWARLGPHGDAAVFKQALPGLARMARMRDVVERYPEQADASTMHFTDEASRGAPMSAPDDYPRPHPDDPAAKLAIGQGLLADARAEPNEVSRAGLLDACIQVLSEAIDADGNPLSRLALGEACYRRARMGPHIDGALLEDAEHALRMALQSDGQPDSASAWYLQCVLQLAPHGLSPARVLARLDEAHALLLRGIQASGSAPAWTAALLTAEWRRLVAACPSASERRLRFRELHAAWAPLLEQETSGDVLAAWADVLCGMAQTLTGQPAMDRYAEAQRALVRLHVQEGASARYARALAKMALGRGRLERGSAKAALLVEAEAVLRPYVDSDDELRLEACRVTLMRAQDATVAEARPLYLRTAELARPLTALPTFAVDALRCMVTSLLALDEEKDRRIYVRCLEVVTDPDDAELLLLLAECHLRTGDYRVGCLQSESAWRGGATFSPTLLGLWQAGHAAWAAGEGASAEVTKNRNCMRIAASTGSSDSRVRAAG